MYYLSVLCVEFVLYLYHVCVCICFGCAVFLVCFVSVVCFSVCVNIFVVCESMNSHDSGDLRKSFKIIGNQVFDLEVLFIGACLCANHLKNKQRSNYLECFYTFFQLP